MRRNIAENFNRLSRVHELTLQTDRQQTIDDRRAGDSKIAIFHYPLAFKPPTEGLPWDHLRKIFRGRQWMTKVPKWRRKIAENFNRLSRVHGRAVGCTNVTDRQTTDGRAIAYSERERESSYHVFIKQ